MNMTTEEKAKAYDEALEKAKMIIVDGGYDEFNNPFVKLFPELKENEDERVRKEIIAFVKSRLAGFPDCNRFIAWLEKQGEQKPAKLSHDDKIMIRQLTEYFTTRTGLQNTDATYVEWLRDLKEKLTHVEQKHIEWSEEDETKLNRICDFLWKNRKGDTSEIYQQEKDISWLKSIRPQQKQVWSEQDIDMINWLIRDYEKKHEELNADRYGHQEIVSDLKRDCRKKWDWLESLKNKVAPQNPWKPSEEQMKA